MNQTVVHGLHTLCVSIPKKLRSPYAPQAYRIADDIYRDTLMCMPSQWKISTHDGIIINNEEDQRVENIIANKKWTTNLKEITCKACLDYAARTGKFRSK